MTHSIATIINYCTNDLAFISPNIRQAVKFSRQIIVPYCDHFYDGSPENQRLLQKSIRQNPEAQFIRFKYNPQTTRSLWRGWQLLLRYLGRGRVFGPQYWICFARQLGYQAIKPPVEYVLFLDADEIINGRKFLQWLNTNQYKQFNALKPSNYWYWRSPRYQATVWEDSPLLAKYSCLNKAVFLDHDERNATYHSLPLPKTRMVLGLDQKPMIHHYAWAKPKVNLLKKVACWGHTKDRNWKKLIQTEFSRPFNGTDFIYKRQYKIVKPFLKSIS